MTPNEPSVLAQCTKKKSTKTTKSSHFFDISVFIVIASSFYLFHMQKKFFLSLFCVNICDMCESIDECCYISEMSEHFAGPIISQNTAIAIYVLMKHWSQSITEDENVETLSEYQSSPDVVNDCLAKYFLFSVSTLFVFSSFLFHFPTNGIIGRFASWPQQICMALSVLT